MTLKSYEVAQVQGTVDLSGSKVMASSLVAVLSGHSCAQKRTNCNHVVEQLLPTSAWGHSGLSELLRSSLCSGDQPGHEADL